jgi:hypothetical protein
VQVAEVSIHSAFEDVLSIISVSICTQSWMKWGFALPNLAITLLVKSLLKSIRFNQRFSVQKVLSSSLLIGSLQP